MPVRDGRSLPPFLDVVTASIISKPWASNWRVLLLYPASAAAESIASSTWDCIVQLRNHALDRPCYLAPRSPTAKTLLGAMRCLWRHTLDEVYPKLGVALQAPRQTGR